MLRAGYDRAYIACLDGVVVVVFHKLESAFQLSLVVDGVGSRLMVHDHLYSLRAGIIPQILQIEIRIRLVEEELSVLAVTAPVFPAFVPSLHQHTVYAVCRREVNVFLDIFRVCRVSSVARKLAVVGDAGFCPVIVGVGPCLLCAGKHLPPHADEFHRLDPACVLDPAGLVEVQYHL